MVAFFQYEKVIQPYKPAEGVVDSLKLKGSNLLDSFSQTFKRYVYTVFAYVLRSESVCVRERDYHTSVSS